MRDLESIKTKNTFTHTQVPSCCWEYQLFDSSFGFPGFNFTFLFISRKKEILKITQPWSNLCGQRLLLLRLTYTVDILYSLFRFVVCCYQNGKKSFSFFNDFISSAGDFLINQNDLKFFFFLPERGMIIISPNLTSAEEGSTCGAFWRVLNFFPYIIPVKFMGSFRICLNYSIIRVLGLWPTLTVEISWGVWCVEQQEGIGISSSSIVLDSLITFILLVFPPLKRIPFYLCIRL